MVSICFIFTFHFNYTAQNAFHQRSERSFCGVCIVNLRSFSECISAVLGCDDDGATVIRKVSDAAAA